MTLIPAENVPIHRQQNDPKHQLRTFMCKLRHSEFWVSYCEKRQKAVFSFVRVISESLPGPLCADNDELDELVEQVFGIILPPISHENLVDFRTLSLNHIARIVRENPISLQEGTIFSICNGLAKNNLLATTDEKICTSSLKLLIEIFSKKHIKDYVDPAITKLVTHFDWLEYYENKSPAVCQLLEDLFNKLNIVNQD